MSKPLATEDTIALPIPEDLAADFVLNESHRIAGLRELFPLRLDDHDLGMWRIDGIATQANDGVPRVIAVLRRVLP